MCSFLTMFTVHSTVKSRGFRGWWNSSSSILYCINIIKCTQCTNVHRMLCWLLVYKKSMCFSNFLKGDIQGGSGAHPQTPRCNCRTPQSTSIFLQGFTTLIFYEVQYHGAIAAPPTTALQLWAAPLSILRCIVWLLYPSTALSNVGSFLVAARWHL